MLPLILFAIVALGLPTAAMVVGAFTAPSTDAGGGGVTLANLRATLTEPYLTSLLTSIKLSTICATVGTVVGLPVAQAVVTSRFPALREAVLAGAGVLANFGGVPLAFAFVATLGNAGVLTGLLHLKDFGWTLYGLSGLVLVYLYFLIPLLQQHYSFFGGHLG